MIKIDLEHWKRKSHYELFSKYMQPCIRLDVRLDVTKLINLKNKTDGFFIPFTYLIMKMANEYEGFRLRCYNGEVVDCEKNNPSFTVLLENNNFAFCKVEFCDDYSEFEKRAREAINQTKEKALKVNSEQCYITNDALDVVYISCMPWIDFVSVSNPLPYGDEMSMSIPRLNWGKYVLEGDKYKMTLSATVSHALIDGFELSNALNSLQQMLNNPQDYIKIAQ